MQIETRRCCIVRKHCSIFGNTGAQILMERSQGDPVQAQLLYQEVCSAAQHLDLFLRRANAHKEVFKPHMQALREVVQQACIKLMFLHPVAYGRKAEELLWRKMYSDIFMLLMKANRKHTDTFRHWGGPLQAHLMGGLKFYEHLFLFLQGHYELRLQSYIDWPHSTIRLIGCQKAGPASEEETTWARMACHRCLLYLGDLFRYQNEFLDMDTKNLAERCYYRALSVAPRMGMPFNQLGALVGSKYYDLEATYFYQCCLHSEVPFKGAAWNLKRLYDRAGERYSCLERYRGRVLSRSQRQCWDNKRLLVSFLYLQSLLQPQRKFKAARLIALCQLVLEDFRLCLAYRPCPSGQCQASTEGKAPKGYLFLPDFLISHMVVLCLMNVHSLRKTGSKQHKPAVMFTLTLFSHLIQHVNTRIHAQLHKEKLTPEVAPPRHGSWKKDTGEVRLPLSKPQRSHTWSCVSSEGYNSEASFHSCCDSDETEDEENTFLSSQGHSDTSSETSYSDTSDEEGSCSLTPSATQEHGVRATPKAADSRSKLKAFTPPNRLLELLKTTISAKQPAPLSQKLPSKHGLHMAPVISHSVVPPQSDLSPDLSSSGTEGDVSGFPDTEFHTRSCVGQQPAIGQCHSDLQSIRRKLEILSAEGLLPIIKVILSWLRSNHGLLSPHLRSSLSLWDHLCVLLNLLPSMGDLQQPGLGLSHHLQNLLRSFQQPHAPRFLQLPEDTAVLQQTPAKASQESSGSEPELPSLSVQEEAIVRICFLRSFGHFATRLPGQLLRFDSKLGVFVSSTERSENPSEQLPRETARIRFSKDIVQLWLQREVALLEKTLRGPQTRSALTPYLFPDPRALCEHLLVIQQLATSGKFFLIIPKIVVDTLYILRGEDSRALEAIAFLEDELKRRNQYILCQSFVSKRLLRPRMTRADSDAWDLYNILDFCQGLLDTSRPGTPDPSSMVTIITGVCLDNPRNFSYPLQLVLGMATEAGVEIKNILGFHREWKVIS
nr:protein SMG5-like isoform X2 [Jaculus jaculus]XP_044998567.1 protein SMG5-like isoform X2 [Jaculus jaculus]XP_044998568.1 protein SMG5-like isoform X2 [Jaculus jaculus]XP_044998569.1 protein SMG5-like isoform X2 [Jaculus jaculus]XP_044998570.1 protein SMG5-like isoform X2 [Jaculus jaculus]XP_044998571.1 protein SMG5-like isoform X2 [Jaculus jaculus]XP_044998572.1 protein SMG5-like isoform X2 [Jaculus jaculus]XP_044998573.1 protein SMG5-like isoform X2 [Jaculus jaculus]